LPPWGGVGASKWLHVIKMDKSVILLINRNAMASQRKREKERERERKREKEREKGGKEEKGRKKEIIWVSRWCSGPDLEKFGPFF
jgi:Ni/Co efflux regulator RcnB